MEQRYQPLSAAEYVAHRQALRTLLPPKALVVLHSNDILSTNADGVLPFIQNNNLFYLTGIDQPDTTLLLSYDAAEESWQELLFLPTPSATAALWDGAGYSAAQAQAQSGIANVQFQADFDRILYQLIVQNTYVFIENNEHYRATKQADNPNTRFIQACQQQYPLHQYRRLAPLMASLRSSKSPPEVQQLQRACTITQAGFEAAAHALRPGVREYELEAACLHEFVRQGASGFAYTPIVASGANACVLHHIQNASLCEAGTLVLLDVGARYGGYNADLTRCIPVDGTFTQRQKDVYNAVLRTLRYAIGLLKPGVVLKNYQQQVTEFLLEEACALGLIDAQTASNDPKALSKYFMHGVSHHLGLDVHDVPLMQEPLQVGAVLTVEPGLYIQEEGIGIRLENNLVITDYGTQDLTEAIPLEIEQIEQLMHAPPQGIS
ncbi:MAG: aminopeptidase P N-terminal domain-containing protein [Gammaproteobacteria bacterium]|nr:aminopeptidase P N-terminal domain-containing protein [Gammaproteobacteria bacterium]